MDSSTKRLHDMIQRMIELDGTTEQKQQLDEMVSMNVSMSGESADEVAALAKLIGNAGMGEPEAPPQETMPMRQDMERLAGIMDTSEASGEECLCCGAVHEGACTEMGPHECACCGEHHDQSHGMSHNESGIEEDSRRKDASEREQLMDLVQKAGKGDRQAKRQFEDYVGSTFNVDAGRLLIKLTKLDDRDRARAIENLIKSERDQGEYQTAASGVRRNQLQMNSMDNEAPVSSCCGAPMDNVQDGFGRCEACGEMATAEYESEFEGYDNEPDEDYQDTEYMTKDISGGLNRQKKQYAKAQDGDNAMAVESIKDRLYAQLSEKKEKPDYADIDDDGDKEEPMKKAAKDKKKKEK